MEAGQFQNRRELALGSPHFGQMPRGLRLQGRYFVRAPMILCRAIALDLLATTHVVLRE